MDEVFNCCLLHEPLFVNEEGITELFILFPKGVTPTRGFNTTTQFLCVPRLSHSLNPHFSNCFLEI